MMDSPNSASLMAMDGMNSNQITADQSASVAASDEFFLKLDGVSPAMPEKALCS
jgi:hypothetical protein